MDRRKTKLLVTGASGLLGNKIVELTKNDSFIVYLGDNLLKGGISECVKEYQNKKYDAMILLSEVEEPQQFCVAEFDKKGNIIRLIEKPKKPPSNYALTGIYFLKLQRYRFFRFEGELFPTTL